MLFFMMLSICLLGMFILSVLPSKLNKTYKYIALFCTNFILFCTIFLWLQFNKNMSTFLFFSCIPLVKKFNIFLLFGVDGIMMLFILLTAFIMPFCVMTSWELKESQNLMFNLLCIEFLLLCSFASWNLFLFCFFFESLLVPMFNIIINWGTRARRLRALSYFFLYTLFGSIFLFLAMFFYFFELGTMNYFFLNSLFVSITKQNVIWGLLFITFAIKVPMFPFHIWLPEAHVEAPTVGSVILAALLLKLGGYGMLRFMLFFNAAKQTYLPIMMTLALLSIFIASFTALRQIDMKKIVAYSSIAHMNFALLGFFSNTIYGIIGGLMLMLSHGIVSAGMFLLIGILYDRHYTRLIYYYGGLVQMMPLYSIFFLLFTISNFSFPGTSNFIGEILVLFGLSMAAHKIAFILAACSTFFGLLYSIFLFNRIMFGNLSLTFIKSYMDLTSREFLMLLPLMMANLFMGLCPQIFINTCYFSVQIWLMQ